MALFVKLPGHIYNKVACQLTQYYVRAKSQILQIERIQYFIIDTACDTTKNSFFE